MRAPVLATGFLAALALSIGALACKSEATGAGFGDDGGAEAAAAGTTPCDPLATTPVALPHVLGAGKDKNGTLYVMAGAAAEPDIYIAHAGGMLEQKPTTGASLGPGDYSITFVDGSTTENLLLQIRNGAPTEMALGPVTSKDFIGVPGAVSEVLTLVDAKTVDGTQAAPLGPVIVYVGDASDGRHVVLLGRSGAPARLFFGAADAMVEHTWTSEPRALSATTFTLDFVANGVSYKFTYGYPMSSSFPTEGGAPAKMLPGQLSGSDGTTATFDSRDPPPQSLSGLSFVCFDRATRQYNTQPHPLAPAPTILQLQVRLRHVHS